MPPTDAPATSDGEIAAEPAAASEDSAPEASAPIEEAAAPQEPAAEATVPEADPAEAGPPAGEASNGAQAPQRREGGQRAGRRDGRAGRAAAPQERGFPRAERPGNVPTPQHHHLPGWVRRDFARARPALADLLGLLQGEERATFQQRVDDLTAGITSGRFSLAWQYPTVIEEGRLLYEGQRSRIAETQRAQRQVETARRRAADRLRDAADLLTPDAAARLSRALRQATDVAAIAEVEAEADRALSTARSAGSRRRDREIERTRNRLLRTLPKAALVEEPQTESWQDVLRRFAEEQSGSPEQETAGAGTGD